MWEANLSNITESATKVAARYSTLSNPYRILILAILADKKRATWSDIKRVLEGYSGTVNPNTLHFHLRALMVTKMIRRWGTNDIIIYTLGDVPDDILVTIKKEIIEKLIWKDYDIQHLTPTTNEVNSNLHEKWITKSRQETFSQGPG